MPYEKTTFRRWPMYLYSNCTAIGFLFYEDGTSQVVRGNAGGSSIQFYGLDSTKTTSFVLMNCEYGILSMAS